MHLCLYATALGTLYNNYFVIVQVHIQQNRAVLHYFLLLLDVAPFLLLSHVYGTVELFTASPSLSTFRPISND